MKIGPCSKCESIIRMTLLLLLSLLNTKGFISLQALGELSENEDGRGGQREGRGGGKGECGTKTGHGFQRVEKGLNMMLD